ncbi:MAG: bifunctional folylpolyglutamate synthase/dihydrofolate synthase [Bacteroidales bacterium]|nr:bifunctional folylpolyglutamate synthase/dihydrofolate synthase [Bacteroidales bacterium]
MKDNQISDSGFAREGDEGRYREALDYLYSRLPMFSRTGGAAYKPGLETSERLDKFFCHPHRRFRSIHIAGTNGKGSCSHTLAAMLQVQGYRTGLYTSPHLVDFRERIRVNGEMIPKEAVTDFTDRWKQSGYEGSPSFFELTMMMAFDWFARAGVEIAVIEVGMGGRLDSTNIITPEACVITNISPDHTQFLGDTLEKIAAEKAGIIKKAIPVVVGEAQGSVREVFRSVAETVGAPLTFADSPIHLMSAHRLTEGGWKCKSDLIGDFTATLAGDYQVKNINTVLCAVDMLRKTGIELSDESVRRGFAEVESLTGLRGRWTRLSEHPLVICDTGHNEAGLTSNMRQLKEIMDARHGSRLQMVVGVVADKDIEHILNILPKEASYIFCNANIPRALPAAELAKRAEAVGLSGKVIPSVKEAYSAALEEAGENDVVYVGGSTFVVADLLA